MSIKLNSESSIRSLLRKVKAEHKRYDSISEDTYTALAYAKEWLIYWSCNTELMDSVRRYIDWSNSCYHVDCGRPCPFGVSFPVWMPEDRWNKASKLRLCYFPISSVQDVYRRHIPKSWFGYVELQSHMPVNLFCNQIVTYFRFRGLK